MGELVCDPLAHYMLSLSRNVDFPIYSSMSHMFQLKPDQKAPLSGLRIVGRLAQREANESVGEVQEGSCMLFEL